MFENAKTLEVTYHAGTGGAGKGARHFRVWHLLLLLAPAVLAVVAIATKL